MDQPRIVRELQLLMLLANNRYMNKEEVCRLEGAARFILGLYDDIEILGGEELRAHVGYRVRMMKG